MLLEAAVHRAAGEAQLAGEELSVPARGERWRLMAAAKVTGVEAGEDKRTIVGKLLPEKELKDMGLEVYRDTAMDSASDTVYKLIPGMLGEPLHEIKKQAASPEPATEPATVPATQPATQPAAAAAPAQQAPSAEERKKSDQELINDLLLKSIRS